MNKLFGPGDEVICTFWCVGLANLPVISGPFTLISNSNEHYISDQTVHRAVLTLWINWACYLHFRSFLAIYLSG